MTEIYSIKEDFIITKLVIELVLIDHDSISLSEAHPSIIRFDRIPRRRSLTNTIVAYHPLDYSVYYMGIM